MFLVWAFLFFFFFSSFRNFAVLVAYLLSTESKLRAQGGQKGHRRPATLNQCFTSNLFFCFETAAGHIEQTLAKTQTQAILFRVFFFGRHFVLSAFTLGPCCDFKDSFRTSGTTSHLSLLLPPSLAVWPFCLAKTLSALTLSRLFPGSPPLPHSSVFIWHLVAPPS